MIRPKKYSKLSSWLYFMAVQAIPSAVLALRRIS
jgi:hypothetical protein